MRILYIHQYFKTPAEGGAIRSWYIATAMVSAGHVVEMVTAYNGKIYKLKKINGINVHYLPVKYRNSFGFFRRILSFLMFSHQAYHLSRDIPSIDVAYITSTPLTVGLVALKLNKKKHIPFVFEIRDLWPEVPIQMGILRNPLLKYVSKYLEKQVYKKANKLVVLSPVMEQYLKRFRLNIPIHICTNMSDCSFFCSDQPKDPKLVDQYKLDGKFIISYFGSIGRSNALEYLIKIVLISQEKSWNIIFFIIGEGAEKKDLVKRVMAAGLKHVHFIDHLNKFELKKYLSITDAGYISFANFSILESNSPNKFFDALASGKLIISNVGGWIRELIEDHSCGFYYDPDQPETFFNKIKPYLRNPKLVINAKTSARKLAERQFERQNITKELFNFLEM